MSDGLEAKDVIKTVIAGLIAIVVFGALLLTMTSTFNEIVNDVTNFSAEARALAAIGPLFLVLGIIAIPIGLALWLFTRFV